MNDAELDRLLECWKAPRVSPSMRRGLRGRYAEIDRRQDRLSHRTLLWVLAGIVGLLLVAVATAQPRDANAGLLKEIVAQARRVWFEFMEGEEARRASKIVARIRQANPQVYVDGRLGRPLDYGPAATLRVHVSSGTYSVMLYQYVSEFDAAGKPTGWQQSGQIYDNVIEFRAGTEQVRIECNATLVDRQHDVFVRRMQE